MIQELIDSKAVKLGASVKTKEAALVMAAELLSGVQEGLGKDELYRLLASREELGSTGIGSGIAIPHATTDKAAGFHLALIVVSAGIDFDSLDGKPVRIIFAMTGPTSMRSMHVRILAALSRMAKHPGFLDTLSVAGSFDEVVKLFRDNEEPDTPEKKTMDKSLFLAVVQKSEYLEPLLEVLTAVTETGITVLEGHGAGRYLHAMPLFSVFWTDENKREDIKVVLAIIDKHMGNDTVRRISSTVAEPAKDSGLLVAIQDLSLVSGSLEL